MRGLEKTPADRFPSIREFADALSQADLGPTARRTSRSMHAMRRSGPRGTAGTVDTSRPNRRSTRQWAMLAAGLTLLTGAGLGAWKVWNPGILTASAGVAGLDPHRIAVLYFQDESIQKSLGYLADGLTEGLIRELDQVPGLDVISKGGVAPFRDGVPRDSVSRALQAGTLVMGDVEEKRGLFRVTVKLVDGGSGADFERASFELPAGNLLAVQDTLAQKVASLIRSRLGEEIRLREQRNRTRNVTAWALVQRAEQARKRAETLVREKDTTDAVRASFEMADSLYGLAHSADAS
jgi:eukaryotic-like serine/threonine-protein kinase